ncbi:MAG: hypothetical protein ACI32N_07495 [Bulleidia sp.]
MLRRIRYGISGKPFSFVFQAVMYTVLFTFLLGSLLIVSLSDVFETVAGRTMSLNVTLSGDETSPVSAENGYYTTDYMDQEKQYLKVVDDLRNRDGVAYCDVNVNAMSTPFHVGTIYDDGSWDFLMERSRVSDDTPTLEQLYDWQPDLPTTAVTVKGVSVSDFTDYRNGDIILSGDYSGRTFTTEELDQGEMVCMVPFSGNADWYRSDGTGNSQQRDEITITSVVFNENNEISAHRSWTLKVVGTYMLTAGRTLMSSRSVNIPVYVPLNTLMKLLDEAAAFQKENDPDYESRLKFKENVIQVYPAILEMDSYASLKNMIRYIQSTDAYAQGLVSPDSELASMAPVITNIETVTSSFRIISWLMIGLTVVFAVVNSCMNCYMRKKESAVLMTMGETKTNIAIQRMMETGLQAFIGMITALPLSHWIVCQFGMELFNSSMQYRDTTIGQALSGTFSLHDVKLSAEELNELFRFSSTDLFIAGVVLVVIVLLVYWLSMVMTERIRLRDTLSAGE